MPSLGQPQGTTQRETNTVLAQTAFILVRVKPTWTQVGNRKMTWAKERPTLEEVSALFSRGDVYVHAREGCLEAVDASPQVSLMGIPRPSGGAAHAVPATLSPSSHTRGFQSLLCLPMERQCGLRRKLAALGAQDWSETWL